MSKISKIALSGTKAKYDFSVYTIDTNFRPIGGVYAFTKRTIGLNGVGTHDVLYIGETSSLAERISNHEKLPRVLARGGNCICVHVEEDPQSRLTKETDLRAGYSTPLNDQ